MLVLVIAGVGFTVTTTIFAVPEHPPANGVTVYVMFCAIVVLLVIVLLKVFVLCVVKLSPVVFTLSAAIHENATPATFDVNGIFTAAPVQIVAVAALVTIGVGLTVTVTVCVVPVHPLDVGVTE